MSRTHEKPGERMQLVPAVVAVLAAALVVLAAFAPRAEAYVYWTSLGSIGRADLDGSHADQYFVGGVGASALAVDAAHIYWVTSGYPTSTIGRANLDGTRVDPAFISGVPGELGDIAVDANHIYWVQTYPADAVGRAGIDGSAVNPSFISPPGGTVRYTRGIAVDANHIYLVRSYPSHTIARANLDGTGIDESFISVSAPAEGVAVDAGHVYWAQADAIGRANLDGSGADPGFIDTRFVGSYTPDAVAVDAAHVYWTWTRPATHDVLPISRATLDGASVQGTFIPRVDAGDLAVDGLAGGLPTRSVAGDASAKRTQRQRGDRVRVKVRVSAEGWLRAEVSGKIRINPAYRLRAKSAEIVPGETTTLRLKPKSRAGEAKLVKSLGRGGRATAKLRVTLTELPADHYGTDSETEKLSVKLRR